MPASNEQWEIFGMKRNGPTIAFGLHFAEDLEKLFDQMIEDNRDSSIIGFIALSVDNGMYFRIANWYGLGYRDALSYPIEKASLMHELHKLHQMESFLATAHLKMQVKFKKGEFEDVIKTIHEIEKRDIPDYTDGRDRKIFAREKMIDLLSRYENICDDIEAKKEELDQLEMEAANA